MFITATELRETIDSYTGSGEQYLYVIRHGESTSNVPDPDTGILLTSGKSLSVELTEKGKDQARRLGAILASKIKEGSKLVICSSTARRAQQTAHEIFTALSPKNECILDLNYEGLCELGQGKWEGLPKDHEYKNDLKKWDQKSAHEKMTTPKLSTGESHQEVAERFRRDLDVIVQKYQGKMIFIVSHHTAINAMILDINKPTLSHEPGSKLPGVSLENCDMVQVRLAAGGVLDQVTSHIKVLENH